MTYSIGIPDEEFARGQVPMTKEEIRTVTLSKGRIFPDAVIYDIGSGTGSLSIEAAHLAPKGQVYAIDFDEEAVELTKLNVDKFGLTNVQVSQGKAPQGVENWPAANTVFIGGSGGNLEEIVDLCRDKLLPGGTMVINAITLETLWLAVQYLENKGFLEVGAVSLNVSRLQKVGRSHMWQGLNPIYIISGSKPLETD